MKLTNKILEQLIFKQMLIKEQTTPVPNPEAAFQKNQEQFAKKASQIKDVDEKEDADIKEVPIEKIKLLKLKATELNTKMDNLPHDDLMSAIKVILSQVSAL